VYAVEKTSLNKGRNSEQKWKQILTASIMHYPVSFKRTWIQYGHIDSTSVAEM